MLTERKQTLALFVDRSTQQWIVRDWDGSFWTISATETPWDDRQPFSPAEETELESVPGHYKNLLGLPHYPESVLR